MEKKDQPSASKITDDKDELAKTMLSKLKDLRYRDLNYEACVIHRVMPLVRNKHNEDYEPKIISIGPLHREKETLQSFGHIKWMYLQDLLNRTEHGNILDEYINKVRQLEEQARRTYAEVVKLDSASFVQMMVVDACFIIELLIKMYLDDDTDKNRGMLYARNWSIALLRNDLLLVENQIPFFILKSLFEASRFQDLHDLEKTGKPSLTLKKIAVSYVTRFKFESIPEELDLDSVHHLLHLYHLSLKPKSVKLRELGNASPKGGTRKHISANIKSLVAESLSKEISKGTRMIPSAGELKKFGVVFKKRNNAASLLDVTFRYPIMDMPALSIQESTAPEFRNLVAFEQCCPQVGNYFTSYAVLLNSLIDTPRDVAILKKCGIIESKLGQDEDVADLFNNLCNGAYLDFNQHYLVNLFRDVNIHCRLNKWRTALMWRNIGKVIIFVIAIYLLVFVTITHFR